MIKFVAGIFFTLLTAGAHAQHETSEEVILQSADVVNRDLVKLEKRYQHILAGLQQQSLHLLDRLQVQDSTVVSLRDRLLASPHPSTIPRIKYLPGLDSVQTALQFLAKCKLPASSLSSLSSLRSAVVRLQDQFQQAGVIQTFVAGKLQQGQAAAQGLQRQLYYYKVQMQQYESLLHDPDKAADKLLRVVRNQPAFRAFFSKNSYLAALFRVPGSEIGVSGSEVAVGQPLPGLQTREQVAALVAERLGPGASFVSVVSGASSDGSNPLAGNMQQAQDQMGQVKEKIASLGRNGSDATMPDFRVNPYHTKTFLQRIQLGLDMQTQSNTGLVPALSVIGVSAGYLLNSRSIVGIGMAYKLGWGQPFEHISFSSQGLAVRSFIDWRWKGSWWLAGGFEANYYSAFSHLSQLRALSAWQSSALAGLMKTYKAGKRAGNVQLLFDALYRQHIPSSQPVVFRVGYAL
jgi:hypothetical protein